MKSSTGEIAASRHPGSSGESGRDVRQGASAVTLAWPTASLEHPMCHPPKFLPSHKGIIRSGARHAPSSASPGGERKLFSLERTTNPDISPPGAGLKFCIACYPSVSWLTRIGNTWVTSRDIHAATADASSGQVSTIDAGHRRRRRLGPDRAAGRGGRRVFLTSVDRRGLSQSRRLGAGGVPSLPEQQRPDPIASPQPDL